MPLKRLDHSKAKSTDDLISQIEHKDRVFRLAQTLFMVSTLIALILVISAQQRTLNTVKAQLVEQKATAQAATKQSDEQRDKIIRRLDCIVVFFTQPDRTNVTIADIDKCSLNRDANLDQFFAQPESTPSEQPPDLAPSTSAPEPGAQPNQPQPVTPETPGLAPGVPDPEPRPPVEVLGIPICVPFTGICVR